MKTIKWWHPFLIAPIACLPYLLISELLCFWWISGSTNGLWWGGLLLAFVTMPSWLLLGQSSLYSLQAYAVQYFGYASEPQYSSHRRFIESQVGIGITALVIFFCILLLTFIAFIFQPNPSFKRDA